MFIEIKPNKIQIQKDMVVIHESCGECHQIEWVDFDQIISEPDENVLTVIAFQKTYNIRFAEDEESSYTSFECFSKMKNFLTNHRSGSLGTASCLSSEEVFVFAQKI